MGRIHTDWHRVKRSPNSESATTATIKHAYTWDATEKQTADHIGPRRRGRLIATTKNTTTSGRDVTAELAYLTRALKAPPCVIPSHGLLSGQGCRTGPTRNTWRHVCNAKSPPASPRAVKDASARHASRPESR